MEPSNVFTKKVDEWEVSQRVGKLLYDSFFDYGDASSTFEQNWFFSQFTEDEMPTVREALENNRDDLPIIKRIVEGLLAYGPLYNAPLDTEPLLESIHVSNELREAISGIQREAEEALTTGILQRDTLLYLVLHGDHVIAFEESLQEESLQEEAEVSSEEENGYLDLVRNCMEDYDESLGRWDSDIVGGLIELHQPSEFKELCMTLLKHSETFSAGKVLLQQFEEHPVGRAILNDGDIQKAIDSL